MRDATVQRIGPENARFAVTRFTRMPYCVAMGRLFDRLIEWLMRPRVRRARRWSFVATLPVGLLIAHVHGVHEGIAVVAARLALSGSVAVAAWRLGGERGDALRDLLMHPRLRAFGRAELDVVMALPRLLLARTARTDRAGSAYSRGTFGLALALAFTPVIVSEALVLDLLLRGGWAAWISTALHAYMLIWLWGFALGARSYPHRVGTRTAVLRAGPMYRVLVPRAAIVSVTEHRERVHGERGLVQRDGAVLLPVRGRVEVWLELSKAVRVQRPLHEPLHTQRLAVASDDAGGLIEQLLSPAPEKRPTQSGAPGGAIGAGLGLLAGLDFAGLARDAAQPG